MADDIGVQFDARAGAIGGVHRAEQVVEGVARPDIGGGRVAAGPGEVVGHFLVAHGQGGGPHLLELGLVLDTTAAGIEGGLADLFTLRRASIRVL